MCGSFQDFGAVLNHKIMDIKDNYSSGSLK
jgi:hypothetical protein